MAEKEAKKVPKKAGKAEAKSVKSLQQDIGVEKQKMAAYSRKMGASVRSLQAAFKKHAKDMKEAASKMRADGIATMTSKVRKFKGDIRSQINENKEAVARIEKGVKFFLSEIDKKKNEFRAYARGPFRGYIKAFWG